MILRLQPLKSKHSLGCDKIEAQDVFSSSQMSWARDRTVKTTIPAHLESKHSESYDKILSKIWDYDSLDKAHNEFSPPPNEGLWPNGDN